MVTRWYWLMTSGKVVMPLFTSTVMHPMGSMYPTGTGVMEALREADGVTVREPLGDALGDVLGDTDDK